MYMYLNFLTRFLFIDSIILESDPTAITHRVALRGDDIPLGEQTVAQVRKLMKVIIRHIHD